MNFKHITRGLFYIKILACSLHAIPPIETAQTLLENFRNDIKLYHGIQNFSFNTLIDYYNSFVSTIEKIRTEQDATDLQNKIQRIVTGLWDEKEKRMRKENKIAFGETIIQTPFVLPPIDEEDEEEQPER